MQEAVLAMYRLMNLPPEISSANLFRKREKPFRSTETIPPAIRVLNRQVYDDAQGEAYQPCVAKEVRNCDPD
jgi:hypothetical protein